MWILTHAFFADTFQSMNAALIFQIGLNNCARAIQGKFTFAGAMESFQRIRTDVMIIKLISKYFNILVSGSFFV